MTSQGLLATGCRLKWMNCSQRGCGSGSNRQCFARHSAAAMHNCPGPVALALKLESSLPFSQSSQLSTIIGFAEALQPRSVLDVGTGMGQYGFLLRTNLEHIHLFEIEGQQGKQRPRAGWQITIDGIEGFAGYRTPVHDYAYNRMIYEDALVALPKLPTGAYELVMAVDILEHFDKEDGLLFLAECQRVASRACLVSTPKDFIEQHVDANPLEDHRSVWSEADLAQAGFGRVLANAQSWVVVQEQR